MAYDRVAQNLVRSAKEADVRVRIVPGISSLDTVSCDLNIDMAPAIQVFETSWLAACQIQPRTDIPLLLMQVGAFGSLRMHYTSRQDGSSLLEFKLSISAFRISGTTTHSWCARGEMKGMKLMFTQSL
jgi:hypothetical protein